MTTIVFATPKGGAGKTTSAFILACVFADKGKKVTIIDADPEHYLTEWEKDGGKVPNLSIVTNDSEKELINQIKEAKGISDLVIVDLEGTANLSILYSVAYADLVIIPTQRSKFDLRKAAETIKAVGSVAKQANRNILSALLITRTPAAIKSRGYRTMAKNIREKDITAFQIEINELEAFKAIFDYSKSLSQLNSSHVSNLESARRIAALFAAEVVQILKQDKTHNQKKKELEAV
ncbi:MULTISPECIES: ParA family protein [Aquimarina]|uniref:ParA family protein n=1 Tax=Aquimarina algiphila TaxID=2047982 RepID=A0A554VCI1_9FLAO|nr:MULTISPECIES: ParA family protein [Aquimarina]TSE04401.1 ParA family protein [Aquimarina algiphila]